jgi:hypothetical protein
MCLKFHQHMDTVMATYTKVFKNMKKAKQLMITSFFNKSSVSPSAVPYCDDIKVYLHFWLNHRIIKHNYSKIIVLHHLFYKIL